MSSGNSIGIDFELITAMMKQIAEQAIDKNAWPTQTQVARSAGTAESVTKDFRREVGVTATFLADAMVDIQDLITVSHDKILAAVNELAKRDESLADEAALIVQLLDAVPVKIAEGATKTTDTASTTSFS